MLLHKFIKKTQKTPGEDIDLAMQRMRNLHDLLRQLMNSAKAQQRSLDYYERLLVTAEADPKYYDIKDIKSSIRYYKKSPFLQIR